LSARINVLLAAYNGENFIDQQIQSILNQTQKPNKIIISIDQSSDDTVDIVRRRTKSFSEIQILSTNKKFGSAAANFINLLLSVDFKDIDYIALADQDDIWKKDKLEKAIQKLEQGYDGYSSNVEAIWIDGKRKVLVKNQPQQNFDYLFESAGPGCTFVITKKLAINLQTFLKNNQDEVSQMKQYHDWLIYAFARTNHYKWFIDGYAGMQYRQHELNDFGAHVGFSGFFVRFKRVLLGEGFDQVLRLIKILKLEKDPFIKQWYPLSRFGFLRLAFYAPQCRRRLREKIYFFFACILLAIIFPKKLCII
jgi:rhamnosyltransferase